jgi:hypothetical protein
MARSICAADSCGVTGGVDRGAANSFYFNPKTGVGVIAFANANDPNFSLSYGVDNIALNLMSWFE